MERTLISLTLPPTTLSLLESAGFVCVRDVLEYASTPIQLARELNATNQEALAVLRLVEEGVSSASSTGPSAAEKVVSTSSSSAVTALELLSGQRRGIVSFIKGLDKLFDGGIPIGEVTEMCGVPGIGKTQLSMQLAVDVQIPTAFGGISGEAVYIDTEGSLMVDRLAQIAGSLVAHLRKTAATRERVNLIESAAQLSVEKLLAGIHVFRVHDYTEQLATVQHLATFLRNHPAVRLVVIDSVALHFRHGFSDMALRTRLLARMAQQLHALADGANAAVVVVNQMTTRVLGSDLAVMEPALGQAWSHTCSNLVQLRWDERVAGHRIAALVKSSHCPCGEAKYEITAAGVRTIGTRSTAAVTSSSGSGSGTADDEAARRMKRQRTT